MAGQAKNQESAPQGGTIVLDITVYSGGSPLPVNADVLPTYTIRTPSGDVAATGTATQVSTGVYHATYNIPLTAQVSNKWKIEWLVILNSQVIPNAYEFFSVVPFGSVSFSSALPIISDDWMEQIKKVMAFPAVPNVLLTDDEIKIFCVKEALHHYFKKFPLTSDTQVTISQELILDFPDSYTFGVLDCRVVNKGFAQNRTSSFWDIYKYNRFYGGAGRSSYRGISSKYNFNGMIQSIKADEQVMRTWQNEASISYYVDNENRQIRIFSNISAEVSIQWAKWSLNFNDVRYVFKYDVVKLAQSLLLRHLADTGGIVSDSSIDKSINIDALNNRADALWTEVKEKWEQYPDVIIMRAI
jgi:hypothetical protein